MPMTIRRAPLAPSGRVLALSILLSFVGAAGVVSLITDSRVEPTLLALPIGLGLITRGEFWRKAALAYVVLNAAVAGGLVAFLLRIAARQSVTTATGALAPRDVSSLQNGAAVFVLIFTFVILSQPEVKALFRPFRTSPGA